MKTSIILTTIVSILLATPQSNAQTETPKNQQTNVGSPNQEEGTQIVFVEHKTLMESIKAAKLKENIFYWSSKEGDQPEVKQDDGKSSLTLKGNITMWRAFEIPEGATKATINLEMKANVDLWVKAKHNAAVTWGFWKDGEIAQTKDRLIWMGTNTDWQTTTRTQVIPEGAQQILIRIKSDKATVLQIAWIEVSFN
jgi:hypothetical protein